MSNTALSAAPVQSLSPEEFDAIDAILDDMRRRFDETPQWEFCEGFMAALVCCRRVIGPDEYLPVLLDTEAFTDAAQRDRFMALWNRRWVEVVEALSNG